MPKPAAARTVLVPKLRLNSNYLVPLVILVVIAVAIIALTIGEAHPKKLTTNLPPPKKPTASACGPYRIDKVIKIDSQAIQTEVAKSNAEFAKGLAGRPCILPNQAMLFPFARPATIPIWMKGMNFPIDIIWINTQHKIVAMEINESPKTYPDKFENKAPAQYVLELQANRAAELGLSLGSTVSL